MVFLLSFLKRKHKYTYGDIARTAKIPSFKRADGKPERGKHVQTFIDKNGHCKYNKKIEIYLNKLIKQGEFENAPKPIKLLVRSINSDQDEPLTEQTGSLWGLDEDAIEKYKAIEGVYQIIRPFSGRRDRYSLEVMSIEAFTNEWHSKKNCCMYSHNEPREDHIYEGRILIGTRYACSLLQRKHESSKKHFAMRGFNLYLDGKNAIDSEEFEPRYCLSGHLLRGKTAKNKSATKEAMAVSFIAIRPKKTETNLRSPTFKKIVVRELSSLGNGYLVGIASKKKSRTIFDFCNNLWGNIEKEMYHESFTLHAVLPHQIEESLDIDSEGDDGAFIKWKATVTEFISQLPPK